jgi:hypothetical protein
MPTRIFLTNTCRSKEFTIWRYASSRSDSRGLFATPENDRPRYTITPQALLTRLLKLNHHRASEEVAQAALSTPTKGIKPKKTQRAKKEDELL